VEFFTVFFSACIEDGCGRGLALEYDCAGDAGACCECGEGDDCGEYEC